MRNFSKYIRKQLPFYFYVYFEGSLPSTRTLGHYAEEAPPILYVPMKIFDFYKTGKRRGNKERVVYISGGSSTHAFS